MKYLMVQWSNFIHLSHTEKVIELMDLDDQSQMKMSKTDSP